MKRSFTVLAVFLLAAASTMPARADTTYGPSQYGSLTTGGDAFNRHFSDPSKGQIAVVRVNPIPGAVNCGGVGGYAYYTISHTVTTPVTEVRARFTDALVDTYAWLTLSVVDAARPYATTKRAGPLLGDGTLVVPATDPLGNGVPVGQTMSIRVGVEVSSACPNVDGGMATFPEVTVVD